MDKLFTLSAELTLETADFLQGLRQAEQSARAAGQAIQGAFSGTASSVCGAWNVIAASIQAAIQKSREFAVLSGSGGLPAAPGSVPGHAAGLAYVPYDNYLARLHQGESVLTRTEAAHGICDVELDVASLGSEVGTIVGSGNHALLQAAADEADGLHAAILRPFKGLRLAPIAAVGREAVSAA